MKQSKKTIAVSAIIAALFLVCAIRGSAAVVPSWLPSGTQLGGYSLVWDDTISVSWYTDQDSNGNVTCYSQVWLKNGTSGLVDANVIGASMVDKGGNKLNSNIDLSKNTVGTNLAKALLVDAGLSQSQIDGIKNIFDVIVEILRANQGTAYTLTEPAISNVDNAVMLHFNAAGDYQYVLFCTRQDHCLAVYSFNASQNWIDWLNATGTGSLILARMQVITWGFWLVLGTVVNAIANIASWLGVSDAPTVPAAPADTEPSVTEIMTSAYTPTSDLNAFASSWGALFPNAVPGYEAWIVVAVAGASFGLLAVKARKQRNA